MVAADADAAGGATINEEQVVARTCFGALEPRRTLVAGKVDARALASLCIQKKHSRGEWKYQLCPSRCRMGSISAVRHLAGNLLPCPLHSFLVHWDLATSN